MKPGAVRHLVFARYRGRVAIVNAFPDVAAAEKLATHLRERYGANGAVFWRSTEDGETDWPWPMLRTALRQLEPMPIARPKRGKALVEPDAASLPSAEQQIADYLAAGGGVTRCPPRRAANPPLRKRVKQDIRHLTGGRR